MLPRTAFGLFVVAIMVSLLASGCAGSPATPLLLPASQPAATSTPQPYTTPVPPVAAAPKLPVGIGSALPPLTQRISPATAASVVEVASFVIRVPSSGFALRGSGATLELRYAWNTGACSLVVGQQPNCTRGEALVAGNGEFYTVARPDPQKVELRAGIDPESAPILSFDWTGTDLRTNSVDAVHGRLLYQSSSAPGLPAFFIRDIQTGQVVERVSLTPWKQHDLAAIESAGFSPNEDFAALPFANPANTGALLGIFRMAAGGGKLLLPGLQAPAFSPDNHYLIAFRSPATPAAAPYQVVDLTTMEATSRALPGLALPSTGIVTRAAFSPDASLIAVGFEDGSVALLGTADGSFHVIQPADKLGPVSALAFSPDGTVLASVSASGMARLWAVQP